MKEFSTDKIKVFNADCMEIMKKYPDKYFDLLFTDLEYGIGASKPSKKPDTVKQKNGNILRVKSPDYKHKEWDFKMSDDAYFQEAKRVSKNQIIFGANYYPQLTGGMIVWDKLNGNSDQYDCEIAYQSFNKRTDLVYYMWQGMFQGVYCGKDIIKALVQHGDKRKNQKRIHPTEKPIKLIEWLLKEYASEGDKILDTHGGGLTTALACDNLGFDVTVCEIDEDYFNDGVERIKQQVFSKIYF